jgi:hypothetical protein
MANGRGNGHDPSRLDRLEGLVEVLVNQHIEFNDEHRRLLTAQVVLTERVDKLAVQVAELRQSMVELRFSQQRTDEQLSKTAEQLRQTAEQSKLTDERLNTLLDAVGIIRQRLP